MGFSAGEISESFQENPFKMFNDWFFLLQDNRYTINSDIIDLFRFFLILINGMADLFQDDMVHYLTDDQFAYAAGVNGIMVRVKPAACLYMG